MKSSLWNAAARAAVCGLALACAPEAAAQAWPAKTVRIVMPFSPGGGTDQMGRLLAKRFTETLGQSFFAENRPGAGGLIGAEIVAKAPPDGYNILVTTASLAVNASLHKKIAFDPVKDLAPVSWLASVPLLLAVHPSVPAKTPQELVALAKKRPGGMNAGTNGAGTTSHLAIEMLKQATGLDVVHIHYKGGGPALVAMLSGEVDFRFTSVLTSIPHIRVGKMRPLAVTTAKPSRILPQLPTLASIYPGVECDQWYAMFVPAGTPKDIVAKLHAETVKALSHDDMKQRLAAQGYDVGGITPEQFAEVIRTDLVRWEKVVRDGNIRVE